MPLIASDRLQTQVLVDSGNAKLVGETIAAVMTAKVPRHRELIGGLALRLGVNPDGSMAVNDDPSGVISAQVPAP